jgi:hypothetical protein
LSQDRNLNIFSEFAGNWRLSFNAKQYDKNSDAVIEDGIVDSSSISPHVYLVRQSEYLIRESELSRKASSRSDGTETSH